MATMSDSPRQHRTCSCVLLAMCLALSSLPVRADEKPLDLRDDDKQAHLLAGFALAFTGSMFLRSRDVERSEAIVYSTLGVAAVGAANRDTHAGLRATRTTARERVERRARPNRCRIPAGTRWGRGPLREDPRCREERETA